MISKYQPGMTVRYLTSPDPSSLRTNEGVIERVFICDKNKEYFINSRWRREQDIVKVISYGKN